MAYDDRLEEDLNSVVVVGVTRECRARPRFPSRSFDSDQQVFKSEADKDLGKGLVDIQLLFGIGQNKVCPLAQRRVSRVAYLGL